MFVLCTVLFHTLAPFGLPNHPMHEAAACDSAQKYQLAGIAGATLFGNLPIQCIRQHSAIAASGCLFLICYPFWHWVEFFWVCESVYVLQSLARVWSNAFCLSPSNEDGSAHDITGRRYQKTRVAAGYSTKKYRWKDDSRDEGLKFLGLLSECSWS